MLQHILTEDNSTLRLLEALNPCFLFSEREGQDWIIIGIITPSLERLAGCWKLWCEMWDEDRSWYHSVDSRPHWEHLSIPIIEIEIAISYKSGVITRNDEYSFIEIPSHGDLLAMSLPLSISSWSSRLFFVSMVVAKSYSSTSNCPQTDTNRLYLQRSLSLSLSQQKCISRIPGLENM